MLRATGIDNLIRLLEKAVEKNLDSNKRVGIVFSGGIDSSVISAIAKKFVDVACYSAYVQASEDSKHIRKAASALDLKLREFEITEEILKKELPSIVKISGKNPVKVGAVTPLYFSAKMAAKDNIKLMLSGQGGDELFGGYKKYLDTILEHGYDTLKEEMENDVRNIYEENLNREIEICKNYGIEIRYPYLDENFVNEVQKIDYSLKVYEIKDPNAKEEFECVDIINGRRFIRKYLLRKIARKLKLPDFIINKRKKASQYSSGSHKLLIKLAKTLNYKEKAKKEGRRDFLRYFIESIYKEHVQNV